MLCAGGGVPVSAGAAESGSAALVTNEGNGDLSQTLAKAHIVISSIEKVVPTREDADTFLRLLARTASGLDLSVYTTFSTGAPRASKARAQRLAEWAMP